MAASPIQLNPPPKEDTWAFQPIGSPFPDNPVKCLGQMNMYVALWYKHGKPIHGRAWNNGGVVECSFPYLKTELTGAKDLGGQIQVLQYKGDHRTLGYWYDWIPYHTRLDLEHSEIVHCGDSLPLFWKDRPQGPLMGYVDNKTETARFSADGVCIEKKGPELANMYLIVRRLRGGPPNCECPQCAKVVPGAPARVRVMLNEWADYRAGDPWPDHKMIRALDKSIDTLPGENKDQYVALWYQAGVPVMGRVYNDNGKIAANFSNRGHEYKNNVGSIQILFEMADHVRGFDYGWIPFPTAALFNADREWHAVHVNNVHGDISPAVITHNGKQILGKVDIKNERACFGYNGQEVQFVGPAVHPAVVLCRRARPGCKFD